MEHLTDLRTKFIIDKGYFDNVELKKAILDQANNGEIKLQKVADTYNCSLRTVQSQAKKRKDNAEIRAHVGRPTILDQVAKGDLVEELHRLRRLQKAPNLPEFTVLVIKFGKETLERRGISGAMSYDVSERAVRGIRKGLDVHKNKGQTTISARQVAQPDIRNFLSVAVMTRGHVLF